MNAKKVVTWLVVAFVVFYVIQAPEASAQLVRNAGHALGNAASSLAAFVALARPRRRVRAGRRGEPRSARARKDIEKYLLANEGVR